MGQLSEGIYLVEDIDDVAKVQVSNPDKLAVVTQTTLSVDDAAGILAAIKARFPNIREPKQQDICYATQNRQGCHQDHGAPGGRGHCGGQPHQLQQQPPA